MPDIQLRFHKDMLVLSGSVDSALSQRGVSRVEEREVLLATEPETVLEPLRLHMVAGAACLVLPTQGITRARLAHVRLEDRATDVARAAFSFVAELTPQHVLAEIGPTGLPLDTTSKASLVANRDQYASAALAFDGLSLDAFFLNGMTSVDDMRCALMGVRKVADTAIFASLNVDETGKVAGCGSSLDEALAVMAEYGADVVGIQTAAEPPAAAALVERMASATDLPLLVQIDVTDVADRSAHNANPYWCADTMVSAADTLRGAGAQFLRATGKASASYTGALAAATFGLDALR